MNRSFTVFFLMFVMLAGAALAQVQITNTSVYKTAEQMLLANEINESGEPFAEDLGYNLDDLDPMVLNSPDSISYTTGIENYEYSRYQLGTIISRSGMGLHMMWAPVVAQMAAMETDPAFDGMFTGGTANGFKEDDELFKTIMHFSMLANRMPPGNPWPQFAEFASGDPHLPQTVDAANFGWADFSTLRWNRSLMDKTLNPAAMGQSLMKQYLWAQDMEGAFHDSLENEVVPDGVVSPDSAGSIHFDPANNVFHGGDNLDGFVGLVLTAEGVNKVKFIIDNLAYDGSSLGAVDPMTYDPAGGIKYFPTAVAVTEGSVHASLPPKWNSLTVTDATSNLFDQFSLLWGTLHFKNMMDPDNSSDTAHLAYHSVFDGDPFPAPMAVTGQPGPFDLMKGTSKVIFQNLMAMHFNGTEGTFVDESTLAGGVAQPGNHISTLNAGYILVDLAMFVDEFAGTPLQTMANDALIAQANFLINNLQDGSGNFYNGYTIGTGADASAKDVTALAAGIRGLYAAYNATGDSAYLNAADNGYQVLASQYYVSTAHAFRTTEISNSAVYTPLNFAVVAGALREAAVVGGQPNAAAQYTRFFKKVANAMQLSEGENTGETGGDSDGDGIPWIPEQTDNLPPVFATEATLDLTITGIVGDGDALANTFRLEQNYPNPFNPTTTIGFAIAEAGQYELNLYSVTGQKVRTLLSKNFAKNNYTYQLTANGLASGVYYYELKGQGFRNVRKLILMK